MAAVDEVTVSVLTPVLNEERHIHDVVERMLAQDVEGEVQLLFADGRSADGTRTILEEFAAKDCRVLVFDNPAGHTAAGLNVALQHATGRYVARMDAHTLYPSHYLSAGVARLACGDIAWVCGPQVPHGQGKWSDRVALALGSRLGVGASNRFAHVRDLEEWELDTGVFTGLWERTVLERHGGWDEGWPINQDSELAARMLAAGERIVSRSEMAALYVPRNSLRTLTRQYRRYGYYRAKTARRHPSSFRRSMVLPPGLVLTALAATLPSRAPAVRRLARVGVGLYAAVVGLESVRLMRGPQRSREVLALMAVFAVMHSTWGLGFLVGCARHALRSPPPLRLASEG